MSRFSFDTEIPTNPCPRKPGPPQEVKKETQNAKEWVEYGIKQVDWWLAFLSAIIALFGIGASIASGYFAKQAKNSENLAKEELEKVKETKKQAATELCGIQQSASNIKELLEKSNIATDEAQKVLDDIKNEKENVSSLLVTQTNPGAASSPSSRRAAKIASEQEDDTYSKFAGEALLAQEKGDYSAALKAWEEAARIDPNAAQAHFGIGYVKQMLASNAKNKEKIQLLNEAKEAYSKTIFIAPDSYASYNNLGNVISDIAILDMNLSVHERRSLLLNACEKYEQAHRIKPDYHEALNNWGVALRGLSVPDLTPDPEERRKRLRSACEKYEQACRIKPDKPEALNNWGVALGKLADSNLTPDPEERRKLLYEAFEKSEQALRIKPDYHEALNNWGVALKGLAIPDLTPAPEKRRKLLLTACEKYEQACRFKPDFHEALNNWGVTLLLISSPELTEERDERVRLLTLAESKFLEARRLNPKIAGYNLACVASLTNRPEECRKWLGQSRQDEALPDCDHLRTDTDLDPVRNEQWFKDFLAEACPEE